MLRGQSSRYRAWPTKGKGASLLPRVKNCKLIRLRGNPGESVRNSRLAQDIGKQFARRTGPPRKIQSVQSRSSAVPGRLRRHAFPGRRTVGNGGEKRTSRGCVILKCSEGDGHKHLRSKKTDMDRPQYCPTIHSSRHETHRPRILPTSTAHPHEATATPLRELLRTTH